MDLYELKKLSPPSKIAAQRWITLPVVIGLSVGLIMVLRIRLLLRHVLTTGRIIGIFGRMMLASFSGTFASFSKPHKIFYNLWQFSQRILVG